MENISTWLAMDGYGGYIWSAYGVAACVLAFMAWRSLARLCRIRQQLQRSEAE